MFATVNNDRMARVLLTVLTLVITLLLSRYEASQPHTIWLLSVFFQALLLYSLLTLLQKIRVLFVIFSVFISSSIFLKLSYGAPLSVSSSMSILNASSTESIDFISFHLPELLLSLFIFICLLIVKKTDIRPESISILLIAGLAYVTTPFLVNIKQLYASEEYKVQLQSALSRGYPPIYSGIEFSIRKMSYRFPLLENIKGISDTLIFILRDPAPTSSWTEVSSNGTSELLVIGIGESLRADNMGIYGYSRNTTPELQRLADKLDIYMQPYSAGTNTWNSLPAIFTRSDTRNGISKSIINLAKDAGYQTVWLSNQARYSDWDFSLSAIIEQSDHIFFPSSQMPGKDYDYILVDKLAALLKEVKSTKKLLVILHFYGSHMSFKKRYPPEYSVFSGSNPLLDQYDNSVLYTDYIQSEIIRIIAAHQGKYLFFSDHGLGHPEGKIPLRHDVRETPETDSLKVPLITYPGEKLFNTQAPISLYYFECFFSVWAGISAAELGEDYCQNKITRSEIQYIDSNLILRKSVLP